MPAAGPVEELAHARLQLGGEIASRTQANASLSGVIEEQLAERSLEAPLEGLLAAWSGADLRQCEFDVLAGAEIVGREVGTRAVVVAGLCAANGHPEAATAVGVEEGELGEDRIIAQVLEAE
ncbi:MAG: hypothetical protein V5B35_07570 [Candidatus Accumulibacter necessarius]